MADKETDMEYQSFGLWRAIWDRVEDVYYYFQDRFGFIFADLAQNTRARLTLEDDGSTTLKLANADGSYIIVADGYVAHYDAEGKKRRVDSYSGTTYYAADGTTRKRDDTASGTMLYHTDGITKLVEITTVGTTVKDTDGTTRALFNKETCAILNDSSNGFLITATGFAITVNNAQRMAGGYTGVLSGSNGTRTYTLNPGLLSNNAEFQATAACGGKSCHALRSTPQ